MSSWTSSSLICYKSRSHSDPWELRILPIPQEKTFLLHLGGMLFVPLELIWWQEQAGSFLRARVIHSPGMSSSHPRVWTDSEVNNYWLKDEFFQENELVFASGTFQLERPHCHLFLQKADLAFKMLLEGSKFEELEEKVCSFHRQFWSMAECLVGGGCHDPCSLFGSPAHRGLAFFTVYPKAEVFRKVKMLQGLI